MICRRTQSLKKAPKKAPDEELEGGGSTSAGRESAVPWGRGGIRGQQRHLFWTLWMVVSGGREVAGGRVLVGGLSVLEPANEGEGWLGWVLVRAGPALSLSLGLADL